MLYFYKGPYDYEWTEICKEEWEMWAKTLEGDKSSGCKVMAQTVPTEALIRYAEEEGFSYFERELHKGNVIIGVHPDSGWQCRVTTIFGEEIFDKQISTLKRAILEAKSQNMILGSTPKDKRRTLVSYEWAFGHLADELQIVRFVRPHEPPAVKYRARLDHTRREDEVDDRC